jgi:serine/threonine-protein kinase RsbW
MTGEKSTYSDKKQMKESTEFKMKAMLENVPWAMACARECARKAGFDGSDLYHIELVVDEACANVVQHAYAGREPGDMAITCLVDKGCFVIQIRDWGRTFDPQAVPKPNVEAPLEERSLGGLGVFLMRQFMDEVEFSFDPEQGNLLTMTKRLPDDHC